jgi:radical SAM superfamily enzyme YgiQ (UPF0313 family)
VDALVDSGRLEQTSKQWQPQFIGISLRNVDDVLVRKRETFFEEVATLVMTIRQNIDCPIILGGSGFSIFPKQLLELTDADFGIAGEGEDSLVSLIAALENGLEFKGIPGLAFRGNAKTISNPTERGRISDDLTDADRPQALVDYYLSTGGMLNVQTQRGCALHCCYCTYPLIEGLRHRRRDAESVASEFKQLKRRGARYVFIVDSVFNSTPLHVAHICEALVRHENKLSWGCFLRPQGLSSELMHLMQRAGLTHIEFGSDSFCDEVLDSYHKGFTAGDVIQSNELAQEAGIDCCHFLIAGGPAETKATLRACFENSKHLKDAVILAVAGMRIYPGTHLFERAVVEGMIAPEADLLRPTYYFSPDLMQDELFEHLRQFSRCAPNWITGDPNASYEAAVTRLRQRGVVGPLWSYLAMIQRIAPMELAAREPAGPTGPSSPAQG